MITCERCKKSFAERRSINVEMDGRNVMLAQFTLCQDCYDYGQLIEPIVRVEAFLNPSHMIITDVEYEPTQYYVMNCQTFEYVNGDDDRAWRTNDAEVAQDKLAEITELKETIVPR